MMDPKVPGARKIPITVRDDEQDAKRRPIMSDVKPSPKTPPVTPSPSPKSKRGNKKAPLGLVFLAVLAVAVVAVLYLIYGKSTQSANAVNTLSVPAETAEPLVHTSALVFQPTFSSNSSTIAVVGLNGSTIRNIDSRPSDSTYNASTISTEDDEQIQGSLLVTSSEGISGFSVLSPDGKSQTVSKSLTPLLSTLTNLNDSPYLNDDITIGNSTLLAMSTASGATATVKLVRASLTTGATSTLLTFTKTINLGTGDMNERLANISRNGTAAYLLADGVTVNGTAIKSVSLITVNLASGAMKVNVLPSAVDPATSAVSNDGKLVAYSVSVGKNVRQSHIYTVSTGQDVAVPAPPQSSTKDTPAGVKAEHSSLTSSAMAFSPDGLYLSDDSLGIISVPSDAYVQQVKQNQTPSDEVTGFGWAGTHTFVYITNVSTTGQATFNPANDLTHSIDAETGKIFDFPKNLGELVAILNS